MKIYLAINFNSTVNVLMCDFIRHRRASYDEWIGHSTIFALNFFKENISTEFEYGKKIPKLSFLQLSTYLLQKKEKNFCKNFLNQLIFFVLRFGPAKLRKNRGHLVSN